MFGFVRPVKAELRVREVERFQNAYCGLCAAIKQRYGIMHTLFLSYDMTFLALLLESLTPEDYQTRQIRCAVSPVCKKCVQCQTPALDYTADISVLLVYHKLSDSIADEHGAKYLAAATARQLIRHGYKKAQARLPQVDLDMAQQLQALTQLEAQKVPSLDRAADPFAQLLTACIPDQQGDTVRILRQLLYHLGRWIYLIDACMDVEEDAKDGNYNPIMARYELQKPILTPIRDKLERTLERSLVSIHAAFQLLPIKRDMQLLENIICLGLPMVTKQVLDKTYKPNGGRKGHGSI